MNQKTKSIARPVASTRSKMRATPPKDAPAQRPSNRKRSVDVDLRTILVPVDFSPGSLNALEFVMSMTRRFDASIVLLHVLDPIYSHRHFNSPQLRPIRAQAFEDAEQQLARLAKRCGQSQTNVDHSLVVGVAYAAIVEAASKKNVDLIVMGSEGRTGLSRVLVGSVAEKVVRLARCPVLVVREKEK